MCGRYAFTEPKTSELKSPGGYTLEGFLDKDTLREEQEIRKKFMKLSDTLATEIASLGIVNLVTKLKKKINGPAKLDNINFLAELNLFQAVFQHCHTPLNKFVLCNQIVIPP